MPKRAYAGRNGLGQIVVTIDETHEALRLRGMPFVTSTEAVLTPDQAALLADTLADLASDDAGNRIAYGDME